MSDENIRVPTYEIEKRGGVLHFSHKERGEAEFDLNTGVSKRHGRIYPSLIGYFLGTSVGKVTAGSRWEYSCHDYYDSRVKIKDDIRYMSDRKYGEFLADKVIPYFYKFTDKGCKNFGNILPFLIQFENMYHWQNENIKCEIITELKPGILPKSHRDIFRQRNIRFTDNIQSALEQDIEFFKRILMLLVEEKIPFIADYNYSQSNWQLLLEALSPMRELIRDYKYEPKAILRYIFNYIEPYEGIKYENAITYLRDYASMHNKMEVSEFKKYPKYLKSLHDIAENEYKNYKKEYSVKLFKKNVKQELAFKCKKFLVVMPDKPDDIKDEGKQLSHCVGSYIERVTEGETQILFMRKTPKTSLLTLEVRDEVLIQAKGYGNRAPEKEELKYIDRYAKEKKLLVRI